MVFLAGKSKFYFNFDHLSTMIVVVRASLVFTANLSECWKRGCPNNKTFIRDRRSGLIMGWGGRGSDRSNGRLQHVRMQPFQRDPEVNYPGP